MTLEKAKALRMGEASVPPFHPHAHSLGKAIPTGL